ncbi:MAG TPA: hypothetical protein VEW90_02080 [Gaiellaceae bacterium]|jgi:hypothetical protein|nr:hypothetical protein [Gaiellaceae bacterium]
MRFAIPLLLAVTAMGLVACSGGDDEAATPVPLEQRFLTADEAPDSSPDPVEMRETTADFAIFIPALSDRSINPDPEEMNEVFEDAGFEAAGWEPRFFGATHLDTSPHVRSSYVELGSEDAASSALDWLEADLQKPCPTSCAGKVRTFEVGDIPEARGVERIATAEDIERLGTEDERPDERYWIGFTVGPVVYTVDLQGPPGSVSEDQAQEIAAAYYERLTGT